MAKPRQRTATITHRVLILFLGCALFAVGGLLTLPTHHQQAFYLAAGGGGSGVSTTTTKESAADVTTQEEDAVAVDAAAASENKSSASSASSSSSSQHERALSAGKGRSMFQGVVESAGSLNAAAGGKARKTTERDLEYAADLLALTTTNNGDDADAGGWRPKRHRLSEFDLQVLRHDYRRRLRRGEFFDYSQAPLASNATTLPPPTALLENATTEVVVVLVLSARANFEARQAIRDTWGKGHAVLFVVGGPDAPHNRTAYVTERVVLPNRQPPDAKVAVRSKQVRCEQQGPSGTTRTRHRKIRGPPKGNCTWLVERNVREWVPAEPSWVPTRLRQEADQFGDVLDVVHPDKYGSLPFKLRKGLQWVLEHVPGVQWIVKADDDMLVRVQTLQRVLLEPLASPAEASLVLGKIHLHGQVFRWGSKYIEYHYPYDWYPPFPLGSYGYVLSRQAAQRVSQKSNNSVQYYQGEDTSVGIWLEQYEQQHPDASPTLWLNHVERFFTNVGSGGGKTNCSSSGTPPWIIHGHYLTPDNIRQCHYHHVDEWPDAWVHKARQYLALCHHNGRACHLRDDDNKNDEKSPRSHNKGALYKYKKAKEERQQVSVAALAK